MYRLFEIIRKLAEFLGPLIEFANRFKEFVALAAFLVLAGLFTLAFLFPQGSFSALLAYLSRLTPNQLFAIVLVAMVMSFGLILLLIVLSYRDVTGSADDRCTLTVMVHHDADVTMPVSGALVTLVLEEAISRRTNEQGGVTFQYSRKWRHQECLINARHEAYETRPPLTVRLQPGVRVYIPLKPAVYPAVPSVAPGSEKVFISCSASDAGQAQVLASLLRQRGFKVWPVQAGGQNGDGFDVRHEQAIRRADFVVALMSQATDRSARMHDEVAFAHDVHKAVVPVRLHPDVRFHNGIRELRRIELYKDWQSEGARLCEHLRSLGSTAAGPANGTAIFTPKVTDVTPQTTPFVFGGAVREDLFVGRREALSLISGRLGGELQSVSVVANRRMGKTSLLNYVAKRYPRLFPGHCSWAVVYMDMMDVRAHTIAGVMRLLRRGIAQQLGRDLWDEKYDGQLHVMAEEFEELAEIDQVRLVLCLDEWENVMAHPELDDLIEQLRSSGSMARLGMVVATAHELSELTASGGLSSPFYNIFETTYLGLMPQAEWVGLVKGAYRRGGREAQPQEIALVGQLAGGHPNLTQLAGSLVWEARDRGWDEAQIRRRYAYQARPIFQGIWNRLTKAQKNAVQEVLGIVSAGPVPREVWDGLKRRGVLNPSGDVFCKAFADFIVSVEMA